jgi:Mg2+/Co2+ transporter CorC
LPEKAGLIGIVTFEDVLEMLLQEQIYDEMDHEQRIGQRLAEMVWRRWKVHTVKQRNNKQNSIVQKQKEPAINNKPPDAQAEVINETTSLLQRNT